MALKDIHGEKLYQEIEVIRKRMKLVRGKEADVVQKAMDEVYHKLKKSPKEDLRLIAKAFSLMLELINACEAAFRSHRLEKYQITEGKKSNSVIYVFTSHPTESRSSNYLKLMGQVEDLLMEALAYDFKCIEERL